MDYCICTHGAKEFRYCCKVKMSNTKHYVYCDLGVCIVESHFSFNMHVHVPGCTCACTVYVM